MIIINFWLPEGNSFDDEEYDMTIAAIVNDSFELGFDEQLIKNCFDNHQFDEPLKADTLYELSFERATIDSDPLPEPAFALTSIRARKLVDGSPSDVIRL